MADWGRRRVTKRLRLMTAVLAVLVALTGGVATQAPPAVGAPAPQYDLAGAWVPIIHEDGNNRAQGGEYEILAGLPLNEAARVRWEAFSEDQWSLKASHRTRAASFRGN